MNAMNQWGPWVPNLDPAERLARLRSLRALARVLAGPCASELCELLHQAETDHAMLLPAADALNRLAPLDMRRVLSTYAGLARPLPPSRSARPGVRVRQFTTPCVLVSSTLHAAA